MWAPYVAKLLNLEHRESALMLWKADATKTNCCLVRILIQRDNWPFFFKNEEERSFAPKDMILTDRLYVLLSWSYTRCFASCFWRWKYQPQRDFGWPPRSYDLAPMDYICGVQKISVRPRSQRKLSICEAIGEVRYTAAYNLLKTVTDCLGYCMVNLESYLN